MDVGRVMDVVLIDGIVIAIPQGASASDVALWYNAGILPDEYEVTTVLFPIMAEEDE